MQNYKETNIQGSEYTRCNRLEVINTLNNRPYVNFYEESVITLSDRVLTAPKGKLETFFDPSQTIPVKNSDGEVEYEISHKELYKILYSLYMQQAEKRDAQLDALMNPVVQVPSNPTDVVQGPLP